jgi:hypothetical protein
VEEDPLELAGPGLLMLPELFCFIIANALDEAILSNKSDEHLTGLFRY